MFVFIKQFISAWKDYPAFCRFWDDYGRKERFYKEHPEAKFPKSRFDYALTNAKIYYSHRNMH